MIKRILIKSDSDNNVVSFAIAISKCLHIHVHVKYIAFMIRWWIFLQMDHDINRCSVNLANKLEELAKAKENVEVKMWVNQCC